MRLRGLEKSQKGHQPPPHTNTQTIRERKGEKKTPGRRNESRAEIMQAKTTKS